MLNPDRSAREREERERTSKVALCSRLACREVGSWGGSFERGVSRARNGRKKETWKWLIAKMEGEQMRIWKWQNLLLSVATKRTRMTLWLSDHRLCLSLDRPFTCLLGWHRNPGSLSVMALLLCVKLRKTWGKQRCMSGWILLWHVSPPAAVCNQEENELLSTRLASFFSVFLSCRGLEGGTISLPLYP